MKENIDSYKFGKEIMNIAYSVIGLAPVNTAEHYYLASHLGFNAIKGDIRLTKDRKLIMCHDPGITVGADGKIARFNKKNHIKFLDYDLEYFKQFEHSTYCEKMGYCAQLCDFETYVRICKENGKLAYVTLRNDKIDLVIPEVLKVLKKYFMEDNCILNSMTFETLVEVRKHTDTIPISYVPTEFEVPEKDVVDKLQSLGNAILTFFFYLCDLYDQHFSRSLWKQAQNVVEYAAEKHMPIYMAQVDSHNDYSMLISKGVQGFQLLRPLLPYQRSDIQFAVTLNGGKATFGNILGSDRLVADVTQNGSIVEIKNIKRNGSGYNFNDGLPALWLNTLPFKMEVNCSNNAECTICYKNNTILLDTNNIDGIYYVNVNI